jgi:hypothetical protein
MSNFKSFLTGFMDQTSDNIRKRKDEAQNYFQEQLEIARTRGLAQRDKMNASMNASLGVAKQLVQVGVPKDLVMSIANQNPDDLPDFLNMIQGLQAKGLRTDPDFFRGLAKTSGTFKAPDEDMGSFFKRLFEPLNTSEGSVDNINHDPEGSLWAQMMGYDAMNRAHRRLDNTEIFDGASAGDLIRGQYQTDISHPYGDSTVTFDYNKLGDATRQAALANKVESPLTTQEAIQIQNQFDQIVTQTRIEAGQHLKETGGDEGMINEDDIRRQAAKLMFEESGIPASKLGQIPGIVKWYTPEEPDTGAVSPPTAPPATTATPVAPAPITAPQQAPTASTEGKPIGRGWTFVKDNGDGTSIITKNGKSVTIDNEAIKGIMGAQNDNVNTDEILNNPTGN